MKKYSDFDLDIVKVSTGNNIQTYSDDGEGGTGGGCSGSSIPVFTLTCECSNDCSHSCIFCYGD